MDWLFSIALIVAWIKGVMFAYTVGLVITLAAFALPPVGIAMGIYSLF